MRCKSWFEWNEVVSHLTSACLVDMIMAVLHFIALYHVVLHCIVLCCVVLHCSVLCCIALFRVVLYCIVPCCVVLHCILFFCIVSCCIVLQEARKHGAPLGGMPDCEMMCLGIPIIICPPACCIII